MFIDSVSNNDCLTKFINLIEVLPKLFSPLLTTKAQGMGFGLAICKCIVEAREGIIADKTSKGKGTTFTATFTIEPKVKMGGEQPE